MNIKSIVLIVLAVMLLGWFAIGHYGYTPRSFIKDLAEPQFKEVTNYSTGQAGYDCSKPIKVQKQRRLVGHLGGGSEWETLYLPVNDDEAKIICQMTWIE